MLSLLEQAVMSIGNFSISILLSKNLSMSNYGIYAIVWMSMMPIVAFFNAWYSSPSLSIYPSLNKQEAEFYLSERTKHLLKINVILFLCWVIFSFLAKSVIGLEAILLGAVVVPQVLLDFTRRVAILRKSLGALLIVECALFISLFASICILNGNFLFICLAISVNYILYGIVLVCLYYQRPISKNSHICELNSSHVRSRNNTFGKWASLATIPQFVSGNAVILVASSILSVGEVGLIRLAQTFVSLFNPALAYLDNYGRVYFATKLRDFGPQVLDESFKKFLAGGCLLSAFLCVLLGLAGVPVIRNFYPELLETKIELYFIVFLGITLMIIINNMLRLKINVLEQPRKIFNSYLISSSFCIAASYPALTFFSSYGVFFVLIGAQACLTGYYLYSSERLMKLPS